MGEDDVYQQFLTVFAALAKLAAAIYSRAVNTVLETPPYITALIVGSILGMILLARFRDKLTRRVRFRRKRGQMMTKKERRLYLRQLMGGKITDVIEDAEEKGEISRSEARKFYRMFSYCCDLKNDVLPQKLPPGVEMSDEAKKRYLQHLINAKLVTIPGPKPGEVDNVVVFEPRKKTWGSSYLNRKTA